MTKTLFILFGLVIIVAGIFLSRSNSVAGVTNGQKFEDWIVNCSEDGKDKKKTCYLVQSLNANKDDKSALVAAYQIGYYGEKKELKIVQILPLEINVASGTSLISSGKLLIPGKFTVCTSAGCNAVGEISQQNLDALFASQENLIGYINSEGKQVNLPFSANGLKEGLKAIK